MSDAPERLWIRPHTEAGLYWNESFGRDDAVEYVRADLFAELEAENERLGIPGAVKAALVGQELKIAELEAQVDRLMEIILNAKEVSIETPLIFGKANE